MSHEPRIQQLADDLAKIGRHPFHAPCGVQLDEARMENSVCVRCATCDGFPCLVHAKSDAEVLAMRPALEHPNVTLLIGTEAVRLETDDRLSVIAPFGVGLVLSPTAGGASHAVLDIALARHASIAALDDTGLEALRSGNAAADLADT